MASRVESELAAPPILLFVYPLDYDVKEGASHIGADDDSEALAWVEGLGFIFETGRSGYPIRVVGAFDVGGKDGSSGRVDADRGR